MGYDRGDSFPFDFEPNGIPFDFEPNGLAFGSKLKGKLSPRSYPIQFEKKYSFLIVVKSGPVNYFAAVDKISYLAPYGRFSYTFI